MCSIAEYPKHTQEDGDANMLRGEALRRIDNPSGHQVCRVCGETRTVAIQNKRYMTIIRFREDGEYDVQHHKVEVKVPRIVSS